MFGLGLFTSRVGGGLRPQRENESARILTGLAGSPGPLDKTPSGIADRPPCGHVFEDKLDL